MLFFWFRYLVTGPSLIIWRVVGRGTDCPIHLVSQEGPTQLSHPGGGIHPVVCHTGLREPSLPVYGTFINENLKGVNGETKKLFLVLI